MRRATLPPVTAALLAVSLLAAPAAAAPSCRGCLQAGAAGVDLPVPAGTPLAGYGALARRLPLPDLLDRHPHAFWFKPHEGAIDPVGARALVLEGEGTRLVWIAADLVAVDRGFHGQVARALATAGLSDRTLILSASHTHSGPGAFLDAGLMGMISVERLDRAVQEALIGALVDAVRRAEAAKRPAHAGTVVVAGPPLTRGRLEQPVDRTLALTAITDGAGAPIAVVWNYAIHGTRLGAGNLRLSGDVMGLATRLIETGLGAPALFVNGAVGDVSPNRRGLAEAQAAAETLAAAVLRAWKRVRPAARVPLAVASRRVALPGPRLSLRRCWTARAPDWASIPLDGLFPPDAEVTAIALGPAAWVTIPGELQSALGEQIREAAGPAWEAVRIAGLTNDYLGYFVRAADAARPSYTACASVFGPRGSERVVQAAVEVLGALPAPGR